MPFLLFGRYSFLVYLVLAVSSLLLSSLIFTHYYFVQYKLGINWDVMAMVVVLMFFFLSNLKDVDGFVWMITHGARTIRVS